MTATPSPLQPPPPNGTSGYPASSQPASTGDQILFGGAARLTQLGNVVISSTRNDTYSYTAEITDSPVEDGTSIQDHRYIKPVEISIEGYIVDSSTSYTGGLPSPAQTGVVVSADDFQNSGGATQNIMQAMKALLDMYASSEVFPVVSAFGTFPSMHFTSLTFDRDTSNRTRLSFSARLKQITVVDTQVVNAQFQPLVHKQVNHGKTALAPTNTKGQAPVASTKTAPTINPPPVSLLYKLGILSGQAQGFGALGQTP